MNCSSVMQQKSQLVGQDYGKEGGHVFVSNGHLSEGSQPNVESKKFFFV